MTLRILPALLLLAGLTQISQAADTDLGQVQSTTVDGQTDINLTNQPPGPPPGTHLWRRPDGSLYMKSGKSTLDVAPGVQVNLTNGNSITAPAPNPGAQQQFDQDLRAWVMSEVNSLSAAVPTAGQSFYALWLPPTLDAEGNATNLFGDAQALVTSAIGFDQGSTLFSILGSSTPDGLTPVRFDFNPAVTALSLSVNVDTSVATFVQGSLYTQPQFVAGEVFGQTVPEPASVAMAALGCACVLLGRKRSVRP